MPYKINIYVLKTLITNKQNNMRPNNNKQWNDNELNTYVAALVISEMAGGDVISSIKYQLSLLSGAWSHLDLTVYQKILINVYNCPKWMHHIKARSLYILNVPEPVGNFSLQVLDLIPGRCWGRFTFFISLFLFSLASIIDSHLQLVR